MRRKIPKFFSKSTVSHIVPENVKGRQFRIFNIHSVAKYEKLKGDPLETLKKLREKVSQSRNNMHKKIDQGRDSNRRPSAWQTSKTILINLYAKCQ